MSYRIARGEDAVIQFVISSGDPSQINAVTSHLRHPTSRALVPADPASIAIPTSLRAATQTLAAGWDISFSAALTATLPADNYLLCSAYTNGTATEFTQDIAVEIYEAAASK